MITSTSLTLFGKRIFIDPNEVPRMQLSPDVPLTPEFRAEFNAWMREFFGMRSTIEDGVVLDMFGDLYMNRATYERLRSEAQRQSIKPLP